MQVSGGGVSDNRKMVLYGHNSTVSVSKGPRVAGVNTRPTVPWKTAHRIARYARPTAPWETAHKVGPGREIMTICGPGRRAGEIGRPGPFQKAGPTHYNFQD